MTFCLVTDGFSPHEMPMARQFAALLGADHFRYIVSESTEEDRKKLGWEVVQFPWCRVIGASRQVASEADERIKNADVVLFGNRTHPLILWRVKRGKVTFYGSERWFKPPFGMLRLAHFRFLKNVIRFWKWSRQGSFYYLAQGVYAAGDMRQLSCFPRRRLLFGYFVNPSEPVPLPKRKEGTLRVLWVGRMLDLKRVDTLIKAVGRLVHDGRAVRLTLVGHGPEEARLRALAEKVNAETRRRRGKGEGQNSPPCPKITFLPPVPISEVRGLMRQADVYVLPSSGTEGWGVVVNEALLEGCAVVASRESGAGATLIRDGRNGLLVPSGDVGALTRALERLDSDETFRYGLATTGQADMLAEWIPSVAAERIVGFCESLLSGREPPQWASGPLSVV